MKNTDILPDKLSDLLELALNDLEKTEKDSNYEIWMGGWHIPSYDRVKCNVCLAGAVMAQTLEYPLSYNATDVYDPKFLALNQVRQGYVTMALWNLGHIDVESWNVHIIRYSVNPIQFKQTLRDLVPHLREKGY